MIASLDGVVSAITKDAAVIVVNGLGFEVRMPSRELTSLHIGQEAHIITTLNVSQDAFTLYGFTTQSSKELFIQLQKVSGIGPKVALSIVGTLGARQLQQAVEQGDITTLAKSPGLGKKGAQKIILELKGSLTFEDSSAEQSRDTSDTAYAQPQDSGMAQVVEGLVYLGWQQKDALEAVQNVIHDRGLQTPIHAKDVPELLRASLAWLDRGR